MYPLKAFPCLSQSGLSMAQYGRGIFMKKQRVMGILSLILGIFLLFAGIYALSHLRTTFAGMIAVSYTHLDVYKRQGR